MTDFSIVTRDEIWSMGERSLLESRLIHGSATQRDLEIRASDACDDELLTRCDEAMNRAHDSMATLREGRARLVVSARRAGDAVRLTTWINATIESLSILSAPAGFVHDAELLVQLASVKPETAINYHGIPILWRNGSAAVLLHEAAGHAAEHRRAACRWPRWLSVSDDPQFDIDDVGARTQKADLLRGEPPHSMLRESFTDVPLPRMSRIVARQEGQSFSPPERRIDIELLAGGSYDPLTDTVAVTVSAANLMNGARPVRLLPFTLIETRQSVARAIRSAAGEPIRYPGVVCSREGQELVVESFAPDMLTVFDV